MLPTTFDETGCAAAQQHNCCLVIDDAVTIDAGNLAAGISNNQRSKIRDVILTHAHLDHIAGLPLFIDDLFNTLTEPIRVYAIQEVIDALDEHIFNWTIYPRFSELTNKNGAVMRYELLDKEKEIAVAHLKIKAVEVNHRVPCVGVIFSDSQSKAAMSGDTAEMDRFWNVVNEEKHLDALFIECAFPNDLDDLARSSNHLTPKVLQRELAKFKHENCPVYAINLKPMYCRQITKELADLNIKNLQVLKVGRIYEI